MSRLKKWLKCPECGEEDDIKVSTHTNEIPGGGANKDTVIRCRTCGKVTSPT